MNVKEQKVTIAGIEAVVGINEKGVTTINSEPAYLFLKANPSFNNEQYRATAGRLREEASAELKTGQAERAREEKKASNRFWVEATSGLAQIEQERKDFDND